MSSGPSEQLRPTASRGACAIEFQQASTVCPVSMRSEPTWVNVIEARMGTVRPWSANTFWIANSAAFRFSVSKAVSGSRRSTPPSRRPRACS
jgi:hypothetical protein